MSITSGTYYVGPSESLINWTSAAAQISGQILNGDVTFIQRGDIIETSSVLWCYGTNIGNYKLLLTSSQPNYGDPNIGNTLTSNISSSGKLWEFSNTILYTSGYIEISNIHFKKTNSPGWAYCLYLSSVPMVIHDCIAFEFNIGGASFAQVQFQGDLTMYNIKTQGLNFAAVQTNIHGIGNIFKIENISCYTSIGTGIACNNANPTSTSNRYIKNCVVINDGIGNPTFNTGLITQSNNASSDSSANGSGSLTNISSSVFKSINPLSSDFLVLTSGSLLANNGIAPTIIGNNLGIAGNPRPHNFFYSIGADEYGVITNMKFVVDKQSGTIPFYFRLTDLSDISGYTSATDYLRIWSITNVRTSSIEYFQTTSASINYCISANSNVEDQYTISLSASYD